MLFNSYKFILLFFPISVVAYYAIGGLGSRMQNAALVAASLAFYASWDVRFVPLLLGSIIVNFAAGQRFRPAPRDAGKPQPASSSPAPSPPIC